MTVIDTYKVLLSKEKLSEDEYNRAAILGWCTELVGTHISIDEIL